MTRLRLSALRVRIPARELVRGVSLELEAGQVVALVGASGSGKSLTAKALLGLVEPEVTQAALEVEVDGVTHRPYAALPSRRAVERAFRPLRGGVLGLLPQDARGSLDPLRRVGSQIAACLRLAERDPNPLPWLDRAGLHDPEAVAGLRPFELSGGMAQRVAIAMALARGSRLLIADEPTTGLDPTVQEEILQQLLLLKAQGVGLLLITHDLRLVPRVADSLLVMHAGQIVERAPASGLHDLRDPHAVELLEATRRVAGGVL